MNRFQLSITLLFLAVFLAPRGYSQNIPMTNTTLSTCSGTLMDPSGTFNYNNNELVVMTICGTAGQCINLNFTLMDMESCCDFINIYDGPNTLSQSLGSYTGTTLPPNISSSSNCLTIEFFSDLSITGAGFAANISCGPCGGGAAATTADCDSAIQVCSATTSFPITANGFGTFDEIPLSGSTANPSINPASANTGCLLSGELNSTWLVFRIQTPGALEFHFGTGANPQTGFYDWIMYDLTNGSCADIRNNAIAPVRCNWNCASSGGTGVASLANQPALASACNYEPPINVAVNDLFVVCFSNWSNANGTVGFNFETGTGNAGVDCSPILQAGDLYLLVDRETGGNRLRWVTQSFADASSYLIERAIDQDDWAVLSDIDASSNHGFEYFDPAVAGGLARYRVAMIDDNGMMTYSNEVEVALPARHGIELFPNPAGERVQLRIGQPMAEKLQLNILDAGGRVLVSETVLAPGLEPVDREIDLNGLSAGMYFLKVNGLVTPLTVTK